MQRRESKEKRTHSMDPRYNKWYFSQVGALHWVCHGAMILPRTPLRGAVLGTGASQNDLQGVHDLLVGPDGYIEELGRPFGMESVCLRSWTRDYWASRFRRPKVRERQEQRELSADDGCLSWLSASVGKRTGEWRTGFGRPKREMISSGGMTLLGPLTLLPLLFN